jgi:hypothetical protein
LRQNIGRQILHAIVEAGQRDAPLVVVQRAENAGQHTDRVLRRAAEQAGMQVTTGGGDAHLVIDEAAQRSGDRRRFRVPHRGVAHQHEVGGEVGLVLFEEGAKMRRADFLLALDQHGDVDWQPARDRDPGAAGLDKGHELALVVLRTARDDDPAPVGMGGDRRLERRVPPQLQRISRLHVVVAVEQDMRPPAAVAAMLADDGRMPLGRPYLGRKAEARKISSEVIGGLPAIGRVSGVGRDRLDPQQRKQPFETGVELGVDMVEHGWKGRMRHEFDPF